jgi:hypothetical protein
MSTMTFLPAWLFAALLPQTLGGTHKPIGRRRQVTIMAIFCLLSFQRFDTLLQTVDLPFQRFGVLLQPFDRLDSFFEPLAQRLFHVLKLMHLLVFLVRYFTPGGPLSPELFQFFFLRHAATLPVLPLILQLHSPSE